MDNNEEIMQMALDLAEKGRGLVEPNPLVGAVIVKDGRIAGKGYHERFGDYHAEVNAIKDAGKDCSGSALYVTLEPCSHHGKTPPCVEAIKQAGIKTVFFAIQDPNHVTKKRGAEILKDAGLVVNEGLLQNEANKLNAPFFKLINEKMPYVTAKWAMSLDGKIATHTGDSRWISNEESRLHVHRIRGRMDAIMVGIGTAITDDPLLTCRVDAERTPARIVIDNNAKLPLDSQLVKTIKDASVIIATTQKAPDNRVKKLEDAGCKIIKVDDNDGLVDLKQVLEELGRRQFTNVLVEGGSRILGSLFDNCLVDKTVTFIAPKIIGGKDAKSPVSGKGITNISQAIQFDDIKISQCGNDTVVEGVVKKLDSR
ncbi:MAG: bifunctional diaminohydroxyphosphoribosylaminopyrimidine deaminase/5-amino-6-(5-phosphoribosylamino)uracil reductase RibD [Candidatus Anammoxibacter sp.]